LTAHDTAKQIIELARQKKGKQIVLMDISQLSTFADYFVIISGDSTIQIKAIADHIVDELHRKDIYPLNKEGYDYLNWVLLDYVDVVVHIFTNEIRKFYGLERLWADAAMEFISDEDL